MTKAVNFWVPILGQTEEDAKEAESVSEAVSQAKTLIGSTLLSSTLTVDLWPKDQPAVMIVKCSRGKIHAIHLYYWAWIFGMDGECGGISKTYNGAYDDAIKYFTDLEDVNVGDFSVRLLEVGTGDRRVFIRGTHERSDLQSGYPA